MWRWDDEREGEMGWTSCLHSMKQCLERIENMMREGRERWKEKWRDRERWGRKREWDGGRHMKNERQKRGLNGPGSPAYAYTVMMCAYAMARIVAIEEKCASIRKHLFSIFPSYQRKTHAWVTDTQNLTQNKHLMFQNSGHQWVINSYLFPSVFNIGTVDLLIYWPLTKKHSLFILLWSP